MKIDVEFDACDAHGNCVIEAPEVFDMDDDMVVVLDQNPGDDLREKVERAAAVCPVAAIRIIDDDAN